MSATSLMLQLGSWVVNWCCMIQLVLLMVLLMCVMAGDWGLGALVIWQVGRGGG